jgi:formylglycine-generating enzyme required for sulfatase activity
MQPSDQRGKGILVHRGSAPLVELRPVRGAVVALLLLPCIAALVGCSQSIKVAGTPPAELGVEPRPPNAFVNRVGMRMVRIPAGSFLMGSPETEKGRYSGEGPQHEVTITRPFYMSACEVTQGQYQKVMEVNPSRFQGADKPVETVSWEDAVGFCRMVSEREGRVYRLPTEAEWEYACRAGSTTAFFCGDAPDDLGQYAWYRPRWLGDFLLFVFPEHFTTRPVGKKRSNPWGLYDMYGNVWEWCQDWYGPYSPRPEVNPTGPREGRRRVLRGGAYANSPRQFRSAARCHYRPSNGLDNVGFRVVCEVSANSKR